MRIGAFEINEPLPELREPHAIAILRPWVNVGRVGTQVLGRLERHFRAKELGRLARPGNFYDFTRYRPRSRMVEERREMVIPNSIVKYASRSEAPDFLFLNLREPHAFGEDYVDSVLELLKLFDVKRYCLLGGMYDVVPHTRPLLVSGYAGAGQPAEEAKKMRVQESSYQGPTSITTSITQEAAKWGMEHMSFVVHLPQYVQLEEDYQGAARLLDLLCSIYQLPPDLADKERGEKQYRELSAAVERNQDLQKVLEQLEAHYDSRQGPVEESPPPPLSGEVERFLRELDQRTEEE